MRGTCLLLAATCTIAAAAMAADSPVTLHAELGLEHARAFHQDAPVLTRADARLSGEYKAERCIAKFALRWRADAHLAPERQYSGELREASVECRQDAWLLKVGRQVVVWGKADNFRVLDAVHAFDYREFLLDDKEAARRPLAMLRLERQMGDEDALQLLVIAERRPDVLPRPGERFAALFPQAALEQLSTPASGQSLPDDLQLGAKWEHTGQRLGYTVNALQRISPQARYTWHADRAALVREHYRQPMVGGSFDLALGAWVLRGETMYTPRAYIPGMPVMAGMPPVYQRYRQLAWVTGVDRSVGEVFFSAQLFETRSRGGEAAPLPGRVQRLASLSATRSFMQDQLKARIFVARDLREDGSWFSASLESELAQGLELTTGLDVFNGVPESALGQIRGQSRLKVGLRLRR